MRLLMNCWNEIVERLNVHKKSTAIQKKSEVQEQALPNHPRVSKRNKPSLSCLLTGWN